jgi:hypothetical protein
MQFSATSVNHLTADLKSAAFVNSGRTGSIPVSGTMIGIRAVPQHPKNQARSPASRGFLSLGAPERVVKSAYENGFLSRHVARCPLWGVRQDTQLDRLIVKNAKQQSTPDRAPMAARAASTANRHKIGA